MGAECPENILVGAGRSLTSSRAWGCKHWPGIEAKVNPMVFKNPPHSDAVWLRGPRSCLRQTYDPRAAHFLLPRALIQETVLMNSLLSCR